MPHNFRRSNQGILIDNTVVMVEERRGTGERRARMLIASPAHMPIVMARPEDEKVTLDLFRVDYSKGVRVVPISFRDTMREVFVGTKYRIEYREAGNFIIESTAPMKTSVIWYGADLVSTVEQAQTRLALNGG